MPLQFHVQECLVWIKKLWISVFSTVRLLANADTHPLLLIFLIKVLENFRVSWFWRRFCRPHRRAIFWAAHGTQWTETWTSIPREAYPPSCLLTSSTTLVCLSTYLSTVFYDTMRFVKTTEVLSLKVVTYLDFRRSPIPAFLKLNPPLTHKYCHIFWLS